MNRLNKILSGLLAVQLAITGLVMSSTGGVTPPRPAPVLPGLDVAKVTRLQVFPSSGDQRGVTASPPVGAVDLVKRGEGWVLSSGHDYPAESTPINELLSKLAGLTHTGPIARSAARAKQLGVAEEDYQRKVVLTVDGKEHALLVGEAVGGRQTAVRLGAVPEVMAVSGLSAWAIDPQVRTWVKPVYSEVARDQLSQVLVQRDGDSVELTKDGGQWKLTSAGAPVTLGTGEVLDVQAVEEVLGQVSRVELTSIGDPKLAGSKALATISVWTTPPKSAEGAGSATATPGAGATAGAPGAAGAGASSAPSLVLTVVEQGGSYWVQKRGDTHAVLVEAGQLRAAVDLSRAKLVKKETKPAAAPAAAGAAPAPAAAGALTPDMVPGLVTP